jgi:hypothetical protein
MPRAAKCKAAEISESEVEAAMLSTAMNALTSKP